MRKRVSLGALLLLCLVIFASSCSSDNNYTDVNKLIRNIYVLDNTSSNKAQGEVEKTILLNEFDGNSESFVLNLRNLYLGENPVPSVIIKPLHLSKGNTETTINGVAKDVLVTVNKKVVNATVHYEASITGNKLSAILEVKDVDGLNGVYKYTSTLLDRLESTDAELLDFSIEHDNIFRTVVYQEQVYVFARPTVTKEDLKAMKFNVEVSPNAVYYTNVLANDQVLDLTGKSVINVISEFGNVKRYPVNCRIVNEMMARTFDFSEPWAQVKDSEALASKEYMLPSPGEKLWSSVDYGLYPLLDKKVIDGLSVNRVEVDGKSVASIKTLLTNPTMQKPVSLASVPYLTPGALYLGSYKHNVNNFLSSTQIGIPFFGEPKNVTATIRYLSGADYRSPVKENNPNETYKVGESENDKDDKCMVFVGLYESFSYEPFMGMLDATSFFNAGSLVAYAKIEEGTTNGFETFSVPMTYVKEYHPGMKHRLGVAFLSSSKATNFEGAIGSTLYVKKLEITE